MVEGLLYPSVVLSLSIECRDFYFHICKFNQDSDMSNKSGSFNVKVKTAQLSVGEHSC